MAKQLLRICTLLIFKVRGQTRQIPIMAFCTVLTEAHVMRYMKQKNDYVFKKNLTKIGVNLLCVCVTYVNT